ncbi:GspH/FimT family pseudopilin [Xanthomonas dyei]|uniref:GspH/FimT family pseudopilin n=1 Tax=Xanthomonas TaxID=338 RepID=UPI000E1F0A92|nr:MULTISPECIES: GspH/FimT family pseudopilin [Xanthomonas]
MDSTLGSVLMYLRQRGFTMLELLVAVVVIGVLAAIAFPNFKSVIQSNQIATASNEVIAAFSFGRSEAVRTNSGAGICPSTNGTSCGGTWDNGLLIWRDDNANGSMDGSEAALRYVQGKGAVVFKGNPPGSFILDRRGRVGGVGAGGVPLSGSQVLLIQPSTCKAGEAELARTLTIGPTGQVRTSKSNCI